jgi:hypothetical protein
VVLGCAELAEQFGSGLVGDAEAGAQRVAGDRLPVLVLVLGGGTARQREQRLAGVVLHRGRQRSGRGRVSGTAGDAVAGSRAACR